MRSPLEDLKDIMGREGWSLLLNLKHEFYVDLAKKLSSSARSNDGRHQLFQGKMDGVNEFFDFVARRTTEEKKTPVTQNASEGRKE